MKQFERVMARGALTGAASIALLACGSANAALVDLLQNGDFTQLSRGVGQLATGTSGGATVATGCSTGGYNLVMTDANVGANNTGGGDVKLWTAGNIDKSHTNAWNGLSASGKGNFLALDGDF